LSHIAAGLHVVSLSAKAVAEERCQRIVVVDQ
jgi:hypothetical protein